MSSNEPRQVLLAINSTEWLNLCARGSIRMSRRRPFQVSTPPKSKEMERVFVAAPFTKLSSSVDLFVLVIKDTWMSRPGKHRSFPSEIGILNLSDVISHHPVAQEHFDYYCNLGLGSGVRLDSAIFENHWISWVLKETYAGSFDAAEILQDALSIPKTGDTTGICKYKWSEIAQLVLRPKDNVKTKPGHLETLLAELHQISDAVASTRETQQFYIACAIEWIEIRIGKDPFKKKSERILLEEALAKAKEAPIGGANTETMAVLDHLLSTYPKAFTEELSPTTIAHIVRLLSESRSRKLHPSTAVQILNSADRDSGAATLISFVLATTLGIELTNKLVIAFSQTDFVDMNWELPN